MIRETSPSRLQGKQARDHILGMLAHELRTPLTAIILTATAELKQASDARQRDRAARILRCAERMRRMTTDLLDFACARVGHGLSLRPQWVDVARLAEEAVTEVEESHPGTHVRVEAHGDTHGEWDPARMQQVLVNLLCTAVQRGRRGAPVALTLVRHPDSLRIEVVNHCDPIPEHDIPTLFEPFADGRSARPHPESVGLGLFIVAEIVGAHGGEVMAFNSPQAGTVTFAVQLPLRSKARE